MHKHHWAVAITAALALSGCRLFDDDETILVSLPKDSFVLTSAGNLVAFNTAAPSQTSTTALQIPATETVLGADIRPADGRLYVLTKVTAGGAAKLYTADPATGVLTAATAATLTNASGGAPITISTASVSMDFNPVADRLRVVVPSSDATVGSQNLRINVTAASNNTTVDNNVNANIQEAAYTNSFATTCQTDLYYLNASQLLLSASPNGVSGNVNTGRLVGATGITATATAFDIRTESNGSNLFQAVITSGGNTRFVSINPQTGAATAGGDLTLPAGETPLALIAPVPATAPTNAVGNTLAVTVVAPQKVVTFNSPPQGSPGKLCSSAAISGLNGDVIQGVDTRPANGQVYAFATAGNVGRLYTLTTAGAATLASTLTAGTPAGASGTSFTGVTGSNFAVDFNPVPDRLRIVSDDGSNLRINVDNGATFVDVPTNVAGTTRAGISAVAYTNSIHDGGTASTTQATTLFGIDSTTNELVLIGNNPADGSACTAGVDGNPNCGDVNTALALGQDVGAVNGLEIHPVNGSALLAGTVGATTQLFSVNLATGAATAAGNFAEAIVGLTSLGGVNATVFGVTPSNKLVSFRPDAPSAVTAIGTLTGLTAGDVIVGMDFRPSVGPNNGQLIVMAQNGGAGRLYSVNPATAVATLLSTLAADPTDAAGAPPFSSLTGVAFGADFNPVPDRLRVVSDAAENLRININSNTGTITDSLLSGDTGNGVYGAAYANNFSSTASAPLFYLVDGLGAANTTLATTGAGGANGGVLTKVGATDLGADFSKVGDLDIVGGQNGFALAALQPATGGKSTLSRINTAAGTATTLGSIDTAGDEPLVGIAIRLQ